MQYSRQELIEKLKAYPLLINEIESPDIELQFIAVKEFPYAIAFIKEPHPHVQKYVIELDEKYVRHINKPSEQLITFLKDPFLKKETEERIAKENKNLFFKTE